MWPPLFVCKRVSLTSIGDGSHSHTVGVIFPYHRSHSHTMGVIPIPQQSYFHTTGVIFSYHGSRIPIRWRYMVFSPEDEGKKFVLTIRMFFTVRMEALHPQWELEPCFHNEDEILPWQGWKPIPIGMRSSREFVPAGHMWREIMVTNLTFHWSSLVEQRWYFLAITGLQPLD